MKKTIGKGFNMENLDLLKFLNKELDDIKINLRLCDKDLKNNLITLGEKITLLKDYSYNTGKKVIIEKILNRVN